MLTATQSNPTSPGVDGTRFSSLGRLIRRPEAGSFLGMVVVFVFFSVVAGEGFLSAAGFAGWLNVAAEVGIVALPIGLLMIAGELDLSIGSIIPASSLCVAIMAGHYGLPESVAVVAALCIGLIVGFVNGFLVLRTAVPSLIVTIGTMFALTGLTLGFSVLLTGATSTSIVPSALSKAIFGQLMGDMFEIVISWWIVIVGVFVYLLHVSSFGNWIYALGGDRVSARNAGIPTERLTISLFMLSGLCAAFLGVCQAMTYQSAQVVGGQSFVFNSIMCVVIGGVLLTGGFGSVIGIVFGTVTFAIANQGVYYTQFDPNLGSVIIGGLLLLAVLMNDSFRRMALSYSVKKK
jgi:simple sugar transport system permease protein